MKCQQEIIQKIISLAREEIQDKEIPKSTPIPSFHSLPNHIPRFPLLPSPSMFSSHTNHASHYVLSLLHSMDQWPRVLALDLILLHLFQFVK
ncbi:hypothetical protein JHK85_006844 [Glycine max]|uniref:Uncharacterized protein n=2 Tax=Glycine subgen. Soja TaxID=1462606 RepID=K7KDM6_SOYBN|nr:hypothetical protein JHK87_006498 [Glycine soja]KAG5054334.1 hypothetical protein JHK85_006844 [Glycine max]KAG5071438.1 hypothetical protein JHK86_006649 [Glycine max]KAH1068945.1 hypothetical protein GYH30_006497 [Glycine max]RZC19531.1 hypothetical protein D0Y65_006384 [Glycine soja]